MNLTTFDPETASLDDLVTAQRMLAARGFYRGKIDGMFGPVSKAALAAYRATPLPGTALCGDGTWGWQAQVDGDDILVLNGHATAFGGSSDKMDSGMTASGYATRGHPDLIACSLPMDGRQFPGLTRGEHAALDGSPLPRMPFGVFRDGRDNPDGCHADVTFLASGLIVRGVPCIDLGPGKRTNHQLDCSVALARRHDPKATANSFSARVDVRIVGGAKWLPAQIAASVHREAA